MSNRNFSEEISEWAEKNLDKLWQHKLLRQLAGGGFLAAETLKEISQEALETAYPKRSLWFVPPSSEAESDTAKFSADDFGIKTSSAAPAELLEVKHISGINRLKEGVTLSFDPEAITVIYGANGSGKSGFTRILKKFAASRAQEDILPNALVDDSNSPSASITFRQGDFQEVATWSHGQSAVDSSFQRARVFDSKAAKSHIEDAQEVAYVPPQIEVITDCAAALGEIKELLESSKQKTLVSAPQFLDVADERFSDLVSKLGTPEARDVIGQIADFTEDQQTKLDNLEKKLGQLKVDSPQNLARRAASRIDSICQFESGLEATDQVLQGISAEKAKNVKESLDSAKAGVEKLQMSLGDVDKLNLAIQEQWPSLWRSIQDFIESLPEQHESRHDSASDWQTCPLCQQDLDEEARMRLVKFEEFIASNANTRLEHAKKAYQSFEGAIQSVATISREEAENKIKALTDQLELEEDEAETLKLQYVSYCQTVGAEIKSLEAIFAGQDEAASTDPGDEEQKTTGTRQRYQQAHQAVKDSLSAIMERLTSERERLESIKDDESGHASLAADTERLKHLKLLSKHKTSLQSAHDSKLMSQAHEVAIGDCRPTKATRFVRKLSEEFIADISDHFQNELREFGFGSDMPVELVLESTKKGISYIHTKLNSSRKNKVHEILSEGEQRIVSLAGFFADLTGSEDKSCLIFDDPVSSLDHKFRAKVARRLVKEQGQRQVVVFTHDFAFARLLNEAVEDINGDFAAAGKPEVFRLQEQQIFRTTDVAGSLAGVEWRRRNLKDQIGCINALFQQVEAEERKNSDLYPALAESLLAGIRETWERVVEELLLNGVVTRMNRAVQTKRLKKVLDITEADIDTVDRAMTIESRLMQGHSDPGELAEETFPSSSEVKKEVDRLVDFHKQIRKRR